MSTRSIVADDLYGMRWVAEPQVSPDGQRIAFVVKTVERETNEYRTSIWVAPVAGGLNAATPFTADGSVPRWSPDGHALAFVSARTGPLPAPDEGEDAAKRDKRCGKGKPQIWLMPVAGGEAHQLTFAKYGAGGPVWSPDGTRLLFTASTGDLPDVPEHNGKSEPRSHRITAFMYRFNGRGYINEQRSHLFVVPAAGGAPTQLTDGDWNDASPAWSPDGSRIAFGSDRSEDRWRMPHGAIWLMNADGSDQHVALIDPDMEYGNASWSPDGASLAVLCEPRWGSGGHTDVAVWRIGSGAPRGLTETHFETFSDTIGTDMRNDHADATPIWSGDGQSLFVLGNARGAGNVYQLQVADGALAPATTGQHHLLGFSLDRGQNTLALALAEAAQPGDIFAHWRDSGTTMRLTDLNHDLLAEVHVSLPETITFTSADGWEIEGWVLKPRILIRARNIR